MATIPARRIRYQKHFHLVYYSDGAWVPICQRPEFCDVAVFCDGLGRKPRERAARDLKAAFATERFKVENGRCPHRVARKSNV